MTSWGWSSPPLPLPALPASSATRLTHSHLFQGPATGQPSRVRARCLPGRGAGPAAAPSSVPGEPGARTCAHVEALRTCSADGALLSATCWRGRWWWSPGPLAQTPGGGPAPPSRASPLSPGRGAPALCVGGLGVGAPRVARGRLLGQSRIPDLTPCVELNALILFDGIYGSVFKMLRSLRF